MKTTIHEDMADIAAGDAADGGAPNTQVGQHREAGIEAAQSRELAQIRTAAQMAMMRPRVEKDAWMRSIKACQRLSMAEAAEYEFPRGNTSITGPSVDLARELARIWGNMRSGFTVVSRDPDWTHLQGYAWDMEANHCVTVEDKFPNLIQRKDKRTGRAEWVAPRDERELRELQNRRGALAERNAILKCLPSDLIEDAVTEARKTRRAHAEGGIAKDRGALVKGMVRAFDEIGVTASDLEAFLGHALDTLTADEHERLVKVGKSIKDGNSRREDYFTPTRTAEADAESQPAALGERLAKKAAKAKQETLVDDSTDMEHD